MWFLDEHKVINIIYDDIRFPEYTGFSWVATDRRMVKWEDYKMKIYSWYEKKQVPWNFKQN